MKEISRSSFVNQPLSLKDFSRTASPKQSDKLVMGILGKEVKVTADDIANLKQVVLRAESQFAQMKLDAFKARNFCLDL
ncbi:hypothetical protein LC612_30495 [Nostoc sp. CHAB 5834]|nr:hypothetical protein [Nostoc sp. CHAB 5834]